MEKIQINHDGGRGANMTWTKTQLLKNAQLYSCTAATQGQSFLFTDLVSPEPYS